MKTNELNKIVGELTTKTAIEMTNAHTNWTNLLSLAKFAGCSKPERQDAIQRIKYAINHYEMREWHQKVLEGIISILEIDPYVE